MADDLKHTLQRISRKAQLLATKYEALKKARRADRERIAELEAAVEELKIANQQLSGRLEYLTIVTTALPDREAVERSRAKLSELMREIDRCIDALTDGCNEG